MKVSSILSIIFILMSCSDISKKTAINTIGPLEKQSAIHTINPYDSLLIPLSEGNMWFFDISYQDISTGRFLEPNQEFPFPQADTLYVHGSTQLDSSPCSLIRTLSVQKGGTWYTPREKGIYSWAQDPQDTTSMPVFSLTYKYPAYNNEKYSANGVNVIVKDTAALISVPAGTFTCYHYFSKTPGPNGGIFENNVWLSKGIGMIKNESVLYTKGVNPVRRIVQLRKYLHSNSASR
jgi:hypothetical protein